MKQARRGVGHYNSRELLGWQLSRSGKATTAASALEQALITRFGTLGRVTKAFLLRSDNGFETQQHAMRIIADWIQFYTTRAHTRSSV